MVWFHKSSWHIQSNSYNQKACSLIQSTMFICRVLLVRPLAFGCLLLSKHTSDDCFYWGFVSSQYFYESLHCRHITRNARSFIHKLDGIFDLRVSALHRAMYGTYSPFSAAFLFLFLLCLLLLLSHPPIVSLCPICITIYYSIYHLLDQQILSIQNFFLALCLTLPNKIHPLTMVFLYPTYQSFCICLSVQSVQSPSVLIVVKWALVLSNIASSAIIGIPFHSIFLHICFIGLWSPSFDEFFEYLCVCLVLSWLFWSEHCNAMHWSCSILPPWAIILSWNPFHPIFLFFPFDLLPCPFDWVRHKVQLVWSLINSKRPFAQFLFESRWRNLSYNIQSVGNFFWPFVCSFIVYREFRSKMELSSPNIWYWWCRYSILWPILAPPLMHLPKTNLLPFVGAYRWRPLIAGQTCNWLVFTTQEEEEEEDKEETNLQL